MRKNQSKKLEIIKNMPSLYHTVPNEKFDITKSPAVLWLVKQPDILNWLWDHVRQSGMIEYDSESKKWKGIDS